MPSCQSRREPPQGWWRSRELEASGEFLVSRREAHVAETVRPATVVVVVVVVEEGQSQARGVTGPRWTRYVCVCVGCVGGATATAIDRLVGDKVGWPRRGVASGQ